MCVIKRTGNWSGMRRARDAVSRLAPPATAAGDQTADGSECDTRSGVLRRRWRLERVHTHVFTQPPLLPPLTVTTFISFFSFPRAVFHVWGGGFSARRRRSRRPRVACRRANIIAQYRNLRARRPAVCYRHPTRNVLVVAIASLSCRRRRRQTSVPRPRILPQPSPTLKKHPLRHRTLAYLIIPKTNFFL